MSRFYVRHVRPLGQGGLSVVDVVEVTSDGGPYSRGTQLARKQLGLQWSKDPGARERFEQEIQLLSSLSHPGVVKVLGLSLPGEQRFYLMPLYRRSLRGLLQEHGRPVTRSWAVDLALSVARTLQYVHGRGFIHRDLKPENILMDEFNRPVVADWGLGQFIHQHSKVLDISAPAATMSMYYCPLEQWVSGRCEASGDVYSLGMILAELVVGYRLPISPAFSGIQQDVAPADNLKSLLFNQIIKKMTASLASARHQSMRAVEVDLINCR